MLNSVIGPGHPANLFELAAAIAAIPAMPPIERAQAAAALIQPAQELLGAERRTAVYQATRTAPYRMVGEALGVTEATINVAISQAPGLIFQVQVDGTDEWLGDEPPMGIAYETGEIFFDPADKTLPFAGRRLVVRFGTVDDGAPIPSLYAYATVNNKRMRATQKVHDLLFTHRCATRA